MAWLISQALMNSLSLPEQEAEYSEESCLDGEQSVQLNVTVTPHKFWRNGKTIDASNLSLFGLTCRVLTENRGEELLTLFRQGFLARTLAAREKEKVCLEKEVDYGQKQHELFKSVSLPIFSLKIAQCLSGEDLKPSCQTLPKWGLMLRGDVYPQHPKAHHTKDYGYGSLLPTPQRVQKRQESCGGEIGRVGRVVKSVSWDRNWEDSLSRLRGMGNGYARAVDRTDCIRNAQVPIVAATAWRILSEAL